MNKCRDCKTHPPFLKTKHHIPRWNQETKDAVQLNTVQYASELSHRYQLLNSVETPPSLWFKNTHPQKEERIIKMGTDWIGSLDSYIRRLDGIWLDCFFIISIEGSWCGKKRYLRANKNKGWCLVTNHVGCNVPGMKSLHSNFKNPPFCFRGQREAYTSLTVEKCWSLCNCVSNWETRRRDSEGGSRGQGERKSETSPNVERTPWRCK